MNNTEKKKTTSVPTIQTPTRWIPRAKWHSLSFPSLRPPALTEPGLASEIVILTPDRRLSATGLSALNPADWRQEEERDRQRQTDRDRPIEAHSESEGMKLRSRKPPKALKHDRAWLPYVSQVWPSGKAGKQTDLGSNPLRLSFFFKSWGLCRGQCLVTLSLTVSQTLKRLSSLPTLMQKSFWW